jgi:hypothetical protein
MTSPEEFAVRPDGFRMIAVGWYTSNCLYHMRERDTRIHIMMCINFYKLIESDL